MKYKLSEIMDIIGGGTPKTSVTSYWGGSIPWLSVKDFNNDFRYVYSSEKTITEEGLNHSATTLLQENDTIISARGTVGEMAMIPFPMAFNQSCYGLRAKSNIVIPTFLYYLVKDNVRTLKKNTHGSVFDTITRDTFDNIEIDLPDIKTQEKIASILQALDDKIAINTKINDNLYQLLNHSFRHDYFEAASEHPEWPLVTLDNVTSKFATGLNPRKNFVLGHGTNYYVTIKNMGNNRIYLDNRCDMVDDEALVKINARSDLRVGDLLFSGIGTIGRVHLIDRPATNWNTSESIFTLRPCDSVSSEFLFLLLLNYDMQDYAISLASGSVQKGIRMADLKRYQLYLPSPEEMKRFNETWKPMISKIKSNEYESDSLAQLRDALLPKLMSGEIDVSSVQI